ncbi:MAG: hypothetical protein HYS24_10285 [Ignavibacteriales bacterium]|nr:hypothetical protein [Ignavibacteriales bacterium]MBK7980965.1 hypothetical protein [Ignavibacteriota bacterium]
MKKTLLIVVILSFLTLTINAQEGKIHVGGQVGLSLPMGDFGDAANMGFGFLGNFYYGINQNIDLTASLGYIAWGTDADGASFSNIPIVVGGRYYFQRSNFTPFLAAELGINNLSFTYDSEYFGEYSATSSDFGLGIGGGFLYALGNMDLDVSAKINIISDTNNLTVFAGLRFPIN